MSDYYSLLVNTGNFEFEFTVLEEAESFEGSSLKTAAPIEQ